MASIVTGILSSTVGLLLNKARNKIADKFKNGDITDAKIREMIVTELNDVKAKIDGLSLSYSLTSYNFLQEGVNLLKSCVDKSEAKPNAVLSGTYCDGGETSAKPSDVKSGIHTDALTLSQALGKVKLNSDEVFETAKRRFEDARKEATRSFFNKALNTKDRIFAAKLRIVAELLECLESPDTAITNCVPFLKTLHSLPAIREIFSVYINGGVRSAFDKAERAENVKSVMLIDYVLFQFVSEFGSKYHSAMSWPTIELADRSSFRPILDWKEVSKRTSWGEEFIQPPNEMILYDEMAPSKSSITDAVCCTSMICHGSINVAVNSRGEVFFTNDHTLMTVISRVGGFKSVPLNYPVDDKVIKRNFLGLAVDCNDNIYVLVYKTMREENGDVSSKYVLYVVDENYNVKQKCTLKFSGANTRKFFYSVGIGIDNNIFLYDYPHVYVYDNAGELLRNFKVQAFSLSSLTTYKNEIFLASSNPEAVHIYTEKGDLVSTIGLPEGHTICGKAFHHVICKIIVLTFIEKSYFLLCYSEAGKLENSSFLCEKDSYEHPGIISHPSGPVVVVRERSIIFV